MKIVKDELVFINKIMRYEVELPNGQIAEIERWKKYDDLGGDNDSGLQITNLDVLKITDEEQDRLQEFIWDIEF